MSRSETRQKTRSVAVRWAPEELDDVQARAALAGATFAEFVRASTLGKRVVGRDVRILINELRRLGGLQKHLAQQHGGRTGAWATEYEALFGALHEAIGQAREVLVR